ncbi:hypothetical protein ACFE04_012008 [Oxalis oulophora]
MFSPIIDIETVHLNGIQIVIRAQARVDVIDPALRRSGRFDAQVEETIKVMRLLIAQLGKEYFICFVGHCNRRTSSGTVGQRTLYTYRFRVPKKGSLKINDLIRGKDMNRLFPITFIEEWLHVPFYIKLMPHHVKKHDDDELADGVEVNNNL